MRVVRLGLSPLKGATHVDLSAVELGPDGPVGDRRWCLVERAPDAGRARVLRTVENPAVLRLRAFLDGDDLFVDLPDGRRLRPHGEPGPEQEADYWGRSALVRTLPGPWDAPLSALLGRDVTLARADRPGQVVWDQPVTLVTTSSLAELARRRGRPPIDAQRFRSTVCVDVGDAAPFVEDTWVGRSLRVGGAELAVRADVARCAVVRLRPGTGEREDDDLLRLLAPDRTRHREVVFGVGGRVTAAGAVRVGDPVTLLPA